MSSKGTRAERLRTSVIAALSLAGVLACGDKLHAQAVSAQTATEMSAICDHCGLERYAHCPEGLETPGFDPQGNLWVAAPRHGLMYKVTPSGCTVGFRLNREGAIMVSWRYLPDGRVLGLDGSNGFFQADLNTGTLKYLESRPVEGGFPGASFHGLDDMVIDSVGGAYVSDALGSSVVERVGQLIYRTPDGVIKRLVPTGLAFPNGVVISPDGKTLYLAEWLSGQILAFPIIRPGEINLYLSRVFATMPTGRGPDGLAMDQVGNIYVADWGGGGQVSVYNSDSIYLGSLHPPAGEKIEPTNLTLHGGYVYVTASNGWVYRGKAKIPPVQLSAAQP